MPPDPRPHNQPWQAETRQRLRTHDSVAEAALWRRLKGRQVADLKFRRQFGVGPYVLDFYCPSARLAVEVDGAVHDDPARARYDAERTQHLAGQGIRVLRVENATVLAHPDVAVAAIEDAAALAGAPRQQAADSNARRAEPGGRGGADQI